MLVDDLGGLLRSWWAGKPGSKFSLARFKRSTVISFVLPLMSSHNVLVKMTENPEGTIIRERKWRFVAVTLHIYVGGHMEIRREINSMMAMPSHRNKLEVLHQRMQSWHK